MKTIYNIIGVDPSLVSTGLTINGKLFNYAKEKSAFNKSGLQKWYKMCEDMVTYRWIEYESEKGEFTDIEVAKIKDYNRVTDMIIKDIIENIDETKETFIMIESYSYSSNAGPLIDLVTFSTLLRIKLLDITENIHIIPPQSLKKESCKLTYEPIEIIKGKVKKKVVYEYRNIDGVAGGNFTKKEMYKVLTENPNYNCEWVNFLREVQSDIMDTKTIKKPIEDLNDSYLLYKCMENILNSKD